MSSLLGTMGLRRQLRTLRRDAAALLRYGSDAPRFAERLWLHPYDVVGALSSPINQKLRGPVATGDWDRHLVPLERLPKIAICLSHWEAGVSWRDAGAYDLMMSLIGETGHAVDGCSTFADVVKRYERLDRLFDTVSQERQLRAAPFRREFGGVLIHLDRDGRPVFGGGGCHRMAIASILALSRMPARLGVVHQQALPFWASRWRS